MLCCWNGRLCGLHHKRRHVFIHLFVQRISDLSQKGIRALKWDVCKDQDFVQARNIIDKEHPEGVFAVIPNAGIEIGSVIEWTSVDEAKLMFDINVFGVMRTMNTFAPALRKYAAAHSHPARVIVLASVAGKIASSPLGLYASTKHAVEAMCDASRVELAPFGIAVSMMEPFYAKTPLVMKTDFHAKHMKYFLSTSPDVQAAYGLKIAQGYGQLQKEVLTAPGTLDSEVVVKKMEEVLRLHWPVDRYMIAPTAVKIVIFLWSDRLAAYGPFIPSDGLRGHLIPVASLHPQNLATGCSKVQLPDNSTDYILLVSRGACNFLEKTRAAQASGAKGLVCGDNIGHGGLVTMYAGSGELSDIQIPSVFVTQWVYRDLYFQASGMDEGMPRLSSLPIILYPNELDMPILEIIIVTILSPAVVMLALFALYSYRVFCRRRHEIAPCVAFAWKTLKMDSSSGNYLASMNFILPVLTDGLRNENEHVPFVNKVAALRFQRRPLHFSAPVPPHLLSRQLKIADDAPISTN
ncbi:hypothetical protein SmJEL517_g04289 [Synchytrium microbalum]|uniref:PA domain-containing protein n=1 Tax=Synchytrium microbalum TaxID=1806994 RepID=A0A507BUM9_9FUNG|nr:uncharacterized protein SmJEL517_g04289 [Synchytrium microbalum]TPX32647.1 hypothetical protein SmJEL517_g04289 [Synchytrium microbalum]